MKRIITLFFSLALISSTKSYAQNVGINNTGSQPDASAMLDIRSSDKGILIPRVALTGADDASTINAPQTSLLVYNTATSGAGNNAVEPGFYFWNGTNWVRLINGGSTTSSPWTLGGNKGTNPSTNFIGTADSTSLQFRVNNQPSGKIDINNINTFFGFQAGKNITTGYGSIGIGQNALMNTTSGYDNIAIGEGTLSANIGGIDNMAIGKFSMSNNTTGSGNVAVGNFTITGNTTGAENTALGKASLYHNISGYGNTGLGFYSMFNNTDGYSNTGVGRTSLYNTTTGYENVAMGRASLVNNTSGFQNTGIGRFSLQTNGTGDQNSALGFMADVGAAALTNATAIGARAYANCSNCLVLGSANAVNGAVSDVSVGISNPNPSQPLSFKNVLGGKVSFWNGGVGHYGMGVQSGLFQFYSDVQGSDIAFGYGKSETFNETMRIKGTGLVGIGTNTPTNSLDIRTNSDLNKVQLRLHENDNEFARMRFTNNTSANFWDIAVKTDVTNANAFLNFYYSPNGQNVLSLRGDGSATLMGALTQNSDIRLKRNIRRIDSPLDRLLRLNGYHYNWIDPQMDAAVQTGVMAQEVQQLFPELVKENEKGTLSVNYMGLIPVLIEAIKEQQKEIEELKRMVKKK